MKNQTNSGAICLSFLLFAALIVGVVPSEFTLAAAQEDGSTDGSGAQSKLYVGRISAVQFSALSAQEEGRSDFNGKPEWVQSGRWIARMQGSGENLTVAFRANIDMVKPDGSAMHSHLVNNFQLSNVSRSGDIITVVRGSATITMADGPVGNVPISLKFYDESLLEIVIGPDKVEGHFGALPIYGTFTYAKTTNLDTGETQSKRFPQPATLPAQALGPAIPSKGYLVEEIRDNLYWVTEGTYNTMFLVGEDGVAAVDAPPTIGDKYLKAIAEVTDKPVKYVIYSHSHLDHIGAANMFPKNATFIAQENIVRELQRAHDLAGNSSFASQLPPIPTVAFADNYTLNVDSGTSSGSGQILQLDYHGNNHEPGNIFIYAPNQKVLMLVDIVFPGWVPFMELAIARDVAGFVEAHDLALGYDFDTFVGGHLTRLGTRQDVETQRSFVFDLIKAAGKANAEVSFADAGQIVGATNDTWAFFNAYIELVNEKCTTEMLSKWAGRLGGAEAFMPSHCGTMTEAMRVNPSVNALSQARQ